MITTNYMISYFGFNLNRKSENIAVISESILCISLVNYDTFKFVLLNSMNHVMDYQSRAW